MRGSTRRRGTGSWEYRLEFGDQQVQVCRACAASKPRDGWWWLEGEPLEVCPHCGGPLETASKRRQKTVVGFKTQKAAQAALDKAKVALSDSSYVEPSKLTVRQFLVDEFLPAVEPTVRASTYASYKGHVHAHLVPLLGPLRLQKLSGAAIDAARASSPPRARGAGARPLAGHHRPHLRHPAQCARAGRAAQLRGPQRCRRGLTAAGSGRGSPRDEVLDGGRGRGLPGRDPRVARVSAVAPARLCRPTPRRSGRSPWDDVQFIPPADDDEDGAELGRLSIRRALVSVAYQVQESEPKTTRGRRTVPLDATTVVALREQAARQADDAAEWGETWTDTGYVFTRESGQPMHPDRVTKLFDAAVDAAKVPRIRLHDLRHTVATRMLEAGVPVKVVWESSATPRWPSRWTATATSFPRCRSRP